MLKNIGDGGVRMGVGKGKTAAHAAHLATEVPITGDAAGEAVEYFIQILLQGAAVWNSWRDQNLGININLSGADLSGADLSGTNLIKANLNDANLSGANLSGANLLRAHLGSANLINADLRNAYLGLASLRHARLGGADLSGASMIIADLRYSDLRYAKMMRADLRHANLTGANITNVNLNGGIFDSTILAQLDFRLVEGLEQVRHTGYSSIGIDTLYRSQGQIPESFLRGCGVDESLIRILPVLFPETSQNLEVEDGEAVQKSRSTEDRLIDAIYGNTPREAEAHSENQSPQNTLRLQIVEEPLTAANFSSTFANLTELHTKCWLLQQNRLADLVTYTQTLNPQFDREANLVIIRLSKNSPTGIDISVAKGTVEAMTTAVESAATLKEKKENLGLKNKELDSQIHIAEDKAQLENRKSEQELEIASEKAQLENRKSEQELEIAKDKAQLENRKSDQELEIAREKAQLEAEKQRIDLRREQVALQREELDLDKQEFEFAKEKAAYIVGLLRPNLDESAKAMAMASIMSNILRLGQSEGLEIIRAVLQLPAPDIRPENGSDEH